MTKGGVASCPTPPRPIALSWASIAAGRQMGHILWL
jgi:hypothetical protein